MHINILYNIYINMVKTIKRKQTKNKNRKTKKQNRKTKKKHQKQKGGNIDELSMIIRDESLDALKEYVKQGKNINKKGSLGGTALMEAVAIQNIDKIKYLIDKGADVNAATENGRTAYSYAFGNDEIVKILKDAGADVDANNQLFLAIIYKNKEAVETLINNREALGIDMNAKDEDGSTFLVSALYYYDNEIITKIINTPGIDLNIKGHGGQTALHIASDDYENAVKLLINAGADLNKQDDDGQTAMHLAVIQEHEDIVKILKDAGADITIKNNEDQTALDLAKESDLQDIIDIIENELPLPPAPPKKTDVKDIVKQVQPAPINSPHFDDVIAMKNTDILTYLSEDSNNVIFIYDQQILGANKTQFNNVIDRKTVVLECKDPNKAFKQPEDNIVKDKENNILYYLNMSAMGGLHGVYVPISQIKTIIDSTKSRIFLVSTLEDEPHKDGGHVITSFGSYDGDDVTSAKHCAEKEPIKFGKLYALDGFSS